MEGQSNLFGEVVRESRKARKIRIGKIRYERDKEIILAKQRLYNARNKDKLAARAKLYRERNREKVKSKQKIWREKNGRHLKGKMLLWNYKLSLDDYEKLLESQGGVCAICNGINRNGKKLSVDHDHQTGAVRSLLCSRCNSVIGYCEDSPTLARGIVKYLEKFSQLTQNDILRTNPYGGPVPRR